MDVHVQCLSYDLMKYSKDHAFVCLSIAGFVKLKLVHGTLNLKIAYVDGRLIRNRKRSTWQVDKQ